MITAHSLLLLRHAKSGWDAPVDDHERPLAPRGERAAAALHDHFAAAGIAPDLVLCSTARRAVETWAAIAPACPGATVEHTLELYGATAGDVFRRVCRVDEAVGTVLVVAHNPTLHALAVGLTGAGDRELVQHLESMYPTGALATLAVPGRWADLRWGAATLTSFVVPRELPTRS